jgi:hypothetical protein
MFWGGTFLAVQYAVTLSDPFFLSACVLRRRRLPWPDFAENLRGLTLKELKAGVAIGMAIAMGYSLQTGAYSPSPAVNRRLLPRCMCRWCRCCNGCVWAECRG